VIDVDVDMLSVLNSSTSSADDNAMENDESIIDFNTLPVKYYNLLVFFNSQGTVTTCPQQRSVTTYFFHGAIASQNYESVKFCVLKL
jgi:hypothetical protein